MKRLFILIFSLAIARVGFGQAIIGNASLQGSAVFGGASQSACQTSDTTNDWSNLLEGWTGPSQERVWWLVNGGAGRTDYELDPDADTSALTTLKPPGACDEAMYFLWGLTNATEAYYATDLSNSIPAATDIMFECYVYPVASPTNGNVAFLSFGNGASPATTRRFALAMTLSSGIGKLQAVGLSSTSVSTGDSIPTNGVWNHVKVFTDALGGATASYLQVNGKTQLTFQRATNDIRYVQLGNCVYGTVNDGGEIYVDILTLNTNSP